MAKARARVERAVPTDIDAAEVTITRGKRDYTVHVYAQEEGIAFQVTSEDLSEPLDFDGPSYEELDGEE